jgi:hypothetical protein
MRERLGWAEANDAGKFNSHQGDDTWYEYIEGKTVVYGDVA